MLVVAALLGCGGDAVPVVGPPLAEGAPLAWLDAVRAANEASAAEGRDLCYLIEPQGRGADGPPATWVRGCDGYRLPTWDEAAGLGRADGFWVWGVGAAGGYRAWPDGEVPAGERRRALRFRGPQ